MEDRDTRILVVDTPEQRPELIRQLAQGPFDLIAEAGYGTEAVTTAAEAEPDAIIVSVEEPVARCYRTIEALSMACPGVAIIAISSNADREYLRKAMQAGAADFLKRPLRTTDQFTAIQEAVQRERRRGGAAPRDALHRGEVITVFGSKGGIGKSMLSVNLAVGIAQETQARVCLLDFDLEMGDVALLLDIVPERTVVDAVMAKDRLEPELLQSIMIADRSGVSILPSPSNPEDSATLSPEQIERVVDVAAKTFDYIVIDTAPSFNDVTAIAISRANLLLYLTTQEVTSLKRTRVALKVLRDHWNFNDDRLKLVLNHAYSANGIHPTDISNTLQYPIYWNVPWDTAAQAASKLGRPVVESHKDSRLGKNVVELARAIGGVKPPQRRLLPAFFGRA